MNRINKLIIGAALAGACIAPVQAQYYGGSSYSHFGNHHSYSIGINDAANLIGAVGTLIHGGDYGYAPQVVYQPYQYPVYLPPVVPQSYPVYIPTPYQQHEVIYLPTAVAKGVRRRPFRDLAVLYRSLDRRLYVGLV